MAKKSKIARNEQRKLVVERYAEKRLALKKALVDPNSTDDQREAARLGLQKLPKNASPAAHAEFLPNSAFPASDSAIWLTEASCRALPSQAGSFKP